MASLSDQLTIITQSLGSILASLQATANTGDLSTADSAPPVATAVAASAETPRRRELTLAGWVRQVQNLCKAVESCFDTNHIKTPKDHYRTFIGITKGKHGAKYERADDVPDATFDNVVRNIKEFWTELMSSYTPKRSYNYIKCGHWAKSDKANAFAALAIAGVVGQMQPLVEYIKDDEKQFPLHTLVETMELVNDQRITLALPEMPMIDCTVRDDLVAALAAHNAEMVLSALKVGYPA